MGVRKLLLGALVMVGAAALAADDAQAFGGSRGSWGSYGGSWGGGGSAGSYGGGGSYGSHGSRGSHGGRFLGRIFNRDSHGSYGSRGSAGSWGSAGSAGSHGSHGSHGGGYAVRDGAVYSGYAANQSRPTEEMVAAAPAKTMLTLRVPAEAKVTLAGVPTKQTGEIREFSTTRLAPGQAWNNYTVQVELVRDGKTFVEKQQITLTGGQSQELSIALDDQTQLAQL